MSVPSDCPESECWQEFFGDTVPPDQWKRCERHLESCPACQERLHRAEGLGGELRSLGRQFGDPTREPCDPRLSQVLERLYGVESPVRATPAEPVDLYFLHPAERPDLLGTLGAYEVEEVIGQGGMGVVLKAFEPTLQRHVAIKVMAPALAGSATTRHRFTREGQAAAAVCHEHVVAVHGVHETDGLPYLVMQYVAGESLQDRLDRTGPLELEEVVRVGLQTAAGLAAAHAQGLIHRDVKPANLLLEDGLAKVKITDFGLARMVDDVPLTQAGVVAGTPEYMAPEQARGELVDHRADLFSLGSVLYALCTGLPPFRGATALDVLRKVSDQAPTPLRDRNPDVPAWLEQLVARLLAKKPPERFQSAAEVAGLLEGYLAHLRQPTTVLAPKLPSSPATGWLESSTAPPRPAAVQGFRRRLWLPLLVLLTALGLSSASFLLQAPLPGEQPPPLDFYQDFRGAGPLPPALNLVGAEGAAIERQDEGLRITVPANRKRTDIAGVLLAVDLKGDFEITTGYEILRADQPQAGHGVGFHLEISTATSRDSHVSFSRLLRIQEGDVYWSTRQTTSEDGKPQYEQNWAPTSARSGQLRLVRSGEHVTFWVAEGGAGAFQKLFEHQVGAENLKTVQVAAYQGWAPNAVDVRVKDLRVRTLTAAEARGVAAQPGAPGPDRPKVWLLTSLVWFLVVTLIVGLWLVVGHRRRARRPAGAPAPGQEAKPGAAVPAVSFWCPGCGQGLRSKAELAGKKLKCPQCGQTVLVPSIQAGNPGRTSA